MRESTLVIGGAKSGVGKTSVTLAIIAALRSRGLAIQSFKVGPDFLDPTYLSRASGRPCYNLDGWMMGIAAVRRCFASHAPGADLSVVEGAMGLFDGADPQSGEGSTAEIAGLLGAPVLLVVDVQGMSRSIAALIKGYAEFDSNVRIVGVILNRVGSPKHAAWLEESLRAYSLPPVVGVIPMGALPTLPHRQLGLVTADDSTLPQTALSQLAAAAEAYLKLDVILAARSGTMAAVHSVDPEPCRHHLRVGVARDRAFHFYYQDNLDALATRAELIELSPLIDEGLPSELDLLYLGGGYPEQHAAELSANKPMREAVRTFADGGGAIYAECGGLLYLAHSLQCIDGSEHAMVGVIPVRSRMTSRRVALGYVEVSLLTPTLLGPVGTAIRGHEFHYSKLDSMPEALPPTWSHAYRLQRRRTTANEKVGFVRGNLLASYVHAHLASRLDVLDHLLWRCSRARPRHQLGISP
jgi:cobyrinic acid a,c-diamide synthase